MSTTTPPDAAQRRDTTPTGTDEPLYRLDCVTRSYRKGETTITPLSCVDLALHRGEFVTIQGPTGGGKSTLLQLLGALDRPSGGEIRFAGLALSGLADAKLTELRAQRMGFVFQSFNLLPTLSARENVDTALEPRGLPREERDRRVAEALARVGLADRADHRPQELSGGQQQRVAIARAIVGKPHVLLADEPTGNLDEDMRDEILSLLEELNREGLTIIAVTHDSAVARRAHRRLRLANGSVTELRD